ncbi:MAG: hypothetical protein HGB34_00125 [Candidatus Moranbacteria bacterium]|nr:hypothetical protein [Candidatus Moranbacteria bacterium]
MDYLDEFLSPFDTRKLKKTGFLLLIDRCNVRDHRYRLYNLINETLGRLGFDVHRFYFDRSPLICRNDAFPGGISVEKLYEDNQDAALILFADGLQFINTGERCPLVFPCYVESLTKWKHRFFVSAQPVPLWGIRERLIAEKLFPVIVPFSPDGMRAVADSLMEEENGRDWFEHWKETGCSYTTTPICVDKDINFIGSLITEPIRKWIAACAMLPELDPGMTQALERLVRPWFKDAEWGWPIHSYLGVSQLLRLEWFVKGYIPNRYRRQMIGSWLTREEVGTICRFLCEQLGDEPDPDREQQFRLALYGVLGEEDATVLNGKTGILSSLLKEPGGERFIDIVVLDYAINAKIIRYNIPEQYLRQIR